MSQTLDPEVTEELIETPESTEEMESSPHPLARYFEWNKWQFLVVMGFCLLFIICNYMRLFYSDIWGHIAYGNWILDHQALPTVEPFVTLAEGMPVMCTAWLGQVVLAIGGRLGGAEAYSAMFAVCVTLTYLILARASYLQTSRLGISALAAMLAWGVNFGRNAVIRPEMFGSLCFAVLLWLAVRSDTDRERNPLSEDDTQPEPLTFGKQLGLWLGVPILFVIWANLHGSFVVGFAVLGAYALGRGLEVFWKDRSLSAVLSDSLFRRWFIAAELAVLASMVNPYGFDLLLHTAMFPSNPNLQNIMEWYSLKIDSVEGITVGLSWVLTLFVFRHSRKRVSPSDVILFAIFTLAACLRIRMVAWYGPVWMIVIAPHLKDVFDQYTEPVLGARYEKFQAWAEEKSSRICLFSLLLIWLTFSFSPISMFVLGGAPRKAELQYHGNTPLGVTKYLRENPPEGLVFNPQWWGDWLVWDGPKNLEVMVTTNAVHVVPFLVWRDYLNISAAQSDREQLLSKYRINTMIVHKQLQRELHQSLLQNPTWRIVYEDDLSLIVKRVRAEAPVEEATPEDQPEAVTKS